MLVYDIDIVLLVCDVVWDLRQLPVLEKKYCIHVNVGTAA